MELANIEFSVNQNDVDADQFVSIWNVASATMGGDAAQARMLASKFLGFLCKHKCGFLVATPTDARYLDDWYERDNSLLNDWTAESDKVDVVAQHVQIPYDLFINFLADKKFSADKNYSPRRADRVKWFTEDWNVA